MEGHNISDPANRSKPIKDLNIRWVNFEVAVDQPRKEETQVGEENIENVDYNPLSPSTESDVTPKLMKKM